LASDDVSYEDLKEELDRAQVALEALRAEPADLLERQWQTTIDSVKDAVWIVDAEQRVMRSNAAAERIFGLPNERMLGRHCWDIVHGTTEPIPECPLLRAVHSLEREIMELSMGEGWFEVTIDPIQDSSGAYSGAVHTVSDITERKRVEQALQDSEALFAAVFRSSPTGINIFRLADDRSIMVNDAYLEIVGYSREEIEGHRLDELDLIVDPAERGAWMEALRAGGELRSQYAKVRTKSGEIRDTLGSLNIIEIKGEPMVLVVVTDITEHERAERALRESQDRFKQVFEAANVGKSMTLPSGVVQVNQAFADMLGYTREELRDKTWRDLTPPEEIEAIQARLDRLASGAEASARFIKRYVHKDGSHVWADVSAAIQRDEGGKPLFFVTTVIDITEHKRADERLRQSEERFSSAFRVGPAGMTITRISDGRFVDVNDSFLEMFGLDRDEVTGRTSTELGVLQLPERGELLQAALESGELRGAELRTYTRSGEALDLLFSSNPIELNGEPCLVTTMIDVTARKRAEEEREKLQAQLSQAQKLESVGRLAGGVAHDFNNMLGVILGHAEMILDRIDEADPLRGDLEEIREAAERSADLTQQLLGFARRQTVAPKVLDLNERVTDIVRMLRRLVGEEIDLRWSPGEGLWPVKIDPSQVDHILANLCANARDAIDGIGTITIATENRAIDDDYCSEYPDLTPGEYVLLAVSDDGRGMDAETQSHLFEPFFTTKAQGKGVGLGLATVYGMVGQNDGFINVYSEPGRGATFKIYLPREKDRTYSDLVESAEQLPIRGREAILLVEDEPAILRMTERMLVGLGYTVVAAETPGRAIELAREHAGTIDLLMTDVILPEMNGRDLAKNILHLYPSVKRLFMSGYTADVIAHRNILDEGVHFIQKPFALKELSTKVREALDQD